MSRPLRVLPLSPDAVRPLDAADHLAVIDLVNRLNLAFDNWDVEAMVLAFDAEGTVHHPRGDVKGHEELRRFYEGYRPVTVGVRRHALNHVVDRNEDGTVTVHHYNLLVRFALPDEAEIISATMAVDNVQGLPAIVTQSVMHDTLRKGPRGWRILHREVPQTVRNANQE